MCTLKELFSVNPRKTLVKEHVSPWLQACNYDENALCCQCFSRNFPEFYRTAVLKNFSYICEAKAIRILTQ